MRRQRTTRTRRTSEGLTIHTYKGFALVCTGEAYNGQGAPWAIHESEMYTHGEAFGARLRVAGSLAAAKELINSYKLESHRGINSVVAMRANKNGQYIGVKYAYMMFFRREGDLWVNINGRKEFAVLSAEKTNAGDVVYGLAPDYTHMTATVFYRSVENA